MTIYLISCTSTRNTLKYIFTNLISVLLFIIIYPKVFSHIFSGYRGTEAFHNLTATTLGERFCLFLWYNQQTPVLLASDNYCILIFSTLYFKKINTLPTNREWYKIKHINSKAVFSDQHFHTTKSIWTFLIVFTIIFPLIIISKTAAFIQFRYISPLYPLISIIASFLILKISQKYVFKNIFLPILHGNNLHRNKLQLWR